MIQVERLWNRLMELSQIGKQPSGGVTRFSFTKVEQRAKQLVASYMEEAGMQVREDAVGNLIGRRDGRRADLPAVLIGSHIDTVPHGGKFDGALGVLAGIEVAQTLNEQQIELDHPIEVIAFTDEEGSRFGLGMIGSRAIAGTLTLEQLQQVDQDGITIWEAMEQSGLDPQNIGEAKREPSTVKAYVELHIEQGRVLEKEGLPAGVVSGIAGPYWTKWNISGEAGHAGATPMDGRKDPLMAATEIMQFMEEQAKKHPATVATVGQISVKPGGVNVIPGEVEFTLDLRAIDEAIRDAVETNIKATAEQVCLKRDVVLNIEHLQRIKPVPCSNSIQEVIREACRKTGVEPITLPSGAGHDGMQFNEWPIGMIFIRSKDGISHNPAEWSSKEDCGKGTKILYETVLALASE
ncbi:Zn-dependent hydrolase [Sporosarcina sp. ACRSL]|uniref:Zn-dependent hydrolase n=1 Tax=Sporosarcina sp. ACRSL TaxID=2918215 RepID=UPI001EF69DA9|nr:Zn-dependent hydrolase [Sporosarcina sp. ACRSL]MCG7346445.1 Zn-dependent hydrolase [Sporosarcina sp. ACRSL]